MDNNITLHLNIFDKLKILIKELSYLNTFTKMLAQQKTHSSKKVEVRWNDKCFPDMEQYFLLVLL